MRHVITQLKLAGTGNVADDQLGAVVKDGRPRARHVIAHQTRRMSVDLSDEGVGDTLISVRSACGDH
jgi:hypothetical protein